MTLNSEFRIVFQPKNPEMYGGKRRFAIGAYSIQKYVGEANAYSAIMKALDRTAMADKFTIKFRANGSITFYNK